MRRRAERPPMPPRRGENFQSPTLPLPPPRDRHSLAQFLDDLAAIPVEAVVNIYRMFDDLNDDADLADLFNDALGTRPIGDVGRFMMLISATGALGHDSALEPLERLVWTDDRDLYHPEDIGVQAETSCCMFAPDGMVQSRAVEMFAWIAKLQADQSLLNVVAQHSSVVVRLAAADAFLYAHRDAEHAKKQVREIAREDDRAAIGVPRFTRDCDRPAFDRAVESVGLAAGSLPGERGVPSRVSRKGVS